MKLWPTLQLIVLDESMARIGRYDKQDVPLIDGQANGDFAVLEWNGLVLLLLYPFRSHLFVKEISRMLALIQSQGQFQKEVNTVIRGGGWFFVEHVSGQPTKLTLSTLLAFGQNHSLGLPRKTDILPILEEFVRHQRPSEWEFKLIGDWN